MAPQLNRRAILRAAGVAAASGAVFTTLPRLATADPDGDEQHVFRHGVASGDPLPDRVVLWTRVTPTDDAHPGSGRGPSSTVRWEVATEDDFREVVRSGEVETGPGRDHTVKVDVSGLDPATRYAYRFRLGGATSPVGRTRTAPAHGAAVNRLRLGVVSCANWQAGFFAAYRYLAERDDLHAVVHLGDYFYEYGSRQYPMGYDIRTHEPATETITLSDYRRRHGQYKTDPDLRALHAKTPWICMWDDHEVANDRWSGGAENHDPESEGSYGARRAAAYRAYFEWMPVRPDDIPLYRRLRFGTLADLSMLDLRSYRSKQVRPFSAEADDPGRTLTGRAQFDWLADGLADSSARWKLVGNPVMIAPLLIPPLPREQLGALLNVLGLPAEGGVLATDQWDGYAADRRRLLSTISRRRVSDVVFLTGDIHTSWANDVPVDAGSYPLSPSVATEFICCSITSDSVGDLLHAPPRTTSLGVETAIKTLNRHVRFVELDSHGSTVLTVTPGEVRMDWYYLDNRARRDSPSRLAHSHRVSSGTPRIVGPPLPVSLP
ncbi:alkaline phosphatase D [Pseudonocardia eucalypti]|uniref:alkaline phosphatase D family protein n=1 Tax=Pseudonocardia eucalypti TaxID=648755 RepID=UPI00160BCB8F|nr:alkaline phosphatase D [Pseudonocardia eucalypti]